MKQIINEIKLSYSKNGIENIKITGSDSAYKLLLDNWDMDTVELQEEFKVLLLNRANIVLGIYNMSKGGVSGTVVDVKLLPNVVIVLIDDLGMGATSSFSCPINTPTMDKLSNSGLRYNNFNTTSLCIVPTTT